MAATPIRLRPCRRMACFLGGTSGGSHDQSSMLAGVAAYETEVRHRRILAGQSAARDRSVHWGGSARGRRIKVTGEQVAAIRRLRSEGGEIAAIARATGLSRPTIYRIPGAECQGSSLPSDGGPARGIACVRRPMVAVSQRRDLTASREMDQRGRGVRFRGTAMIPTEWKSKLSKHMSYPIGAGTLSEALADAPNIEAMTLFFGNSQWPASGTRRSARRSDAPRHPDRRVLACRLSGEQRELVSARPRRPS